MKRYFIFILLILCGLLEVQAQKISNLDKLTIENNISIDTLSNNDLVAIKEITLYNISNESIKGRLEQFPNLKTIIIIDCPDINFKKLFRELKKCKKVNNIILDGNDITELNSGITKIENLIKIEIKNNPNLNLENVINQLKTIKTLREVALPINEIFDIPENISELTNITTLDLRNNFLSDLPDEIEDMDSLNSLNLEENIIIDPINTLTKLKKLNIKYLSFDKEGLSEEEISTLKKLFPNTVIIAKEKANEEALEKINDIAKVSSTKTNIVTNSGSELKAYSTAYLYFPYIYRDKRLFTNIDTLNLNERYISYDYINVYPKKTIKDYYLYYTQNYLGYRNQGYFSLKAKKDKEFNGIKIYYKIKKRQTKNHGIYYNNPEVNTFNNYTILYKGSMSKRELKKLFRNERYSDIRYYFEHSSNSFRMEIKGDSINFSLDIQPMNKLLKMNPKIIDKTYYKLNKQYKKGLNRRIKSFDRVLLKQKRNHIRNQNSLRREIWSTFQKDYMSIEEKNMSNEDWIIYYEKVISNENIAINNAPISIQNIERGIELKGILERKYTLSNKDSLFLVYTSFFNNRKKELKIDKYIFIDKTRNEFVSDRTAKSDIFYSNNKQRKLTKNYLYKNSIFDILIQYNNGDIGIARDITFKETDDLQAVIFIKIDSKHNSVSDIYKLLGI